MGSYLERSMLTRQQQKIFEIFRLKSFEELTFQQIKEFTKVTSNSNIQQALQQFQKDNLITKRKIGNIILYKLNLRNDDIFTHAHDLPVIARLSLQEIFESINDPFYSLIVFGSYANNTQTNKSDLDVVVITQNKREAEIAIKNSQLRSVLTLDAYVFTKEEFLEMLLNKEANLGKLAVLKHKAIRNPAIFYSIILEAISRGYNPISGKS